MFTGILGTRHAVPGRLVLAHVPAPADEGRAWTYGRTETATYGGTAAWTYGETPDWTYEPVTG